MFLVEIKTIIYLKTKKPQKFGKDYLPRIISKLMWPLLVVKLLDMSVASKPGEQIFYYEAKKNWWSRAGTPAKCRSVNLEARTQKCFMILGQSTTQSGVSTVILTATVGALRKSGNNVFMQYVKPATKNLLNLNTKTLTSVAV